MHFDLMHCNFVVFDSIHIIVVFDWVRNFADSIDFD